MGEDWRLAIREKVFVADRVREMSVSKKGVKGKKKRKLSQKSLSEILVWTWKWKSCALQKRNARAKVKGNCRGRLKSVGGREGQIGTVGKSRPFYV